MYIYLFEQKKQLSIINTGTMPPEIRVTTHSIKTRNEDLL